MSLGTNATERLRITSAGLVRVPDNGKFTAGTGDDLEIYFDATYARIQSGSNTMLIRSNLIEFGDAGGNKYIKCVDGGTTEIYHNANKKFETTTTGVTVTGTVSDSKGDLRKIIFKQESSAYTLVAADAGKAIEIATGGITVPVNVFVGGDAITIINDSGSNQTITQGSSVTMFNSAAGDSSSGNRTLAARGMATVYFVNSSTCYISGAGLS